MNTQVEQFLNAQKAREEQERAARKEAHLIRLGLIDHEKSTKDEIFPVETTDEEYAEICKYSPEVEEVVPVIKKSAEITMKTIAVIVCLFGIILSVRCLIAGVILTNTGDYNQLLIGCGCFAVCLFNLLQTLTVWSRLKVFANISLTVKKIEVKK